jgi:hypothetical protein
MNIIRENKSKQGKGAILVQLAFMMLFALPSAKGFPEPFGPWEET